MKRVFIVELLIIITCMRMGTLQAAVSQKLLVGPNNRYLVKENGDAFVWIGTTMWWWENLTLARIKKIIDDQHGRGFTVLMTVAYEDRYDSLDVLVDYARRRDTYVALNCFWHQQIYSMTDSALYQHGYEIGHRYRDTKNIIWLTAGEAGGHYRRDTIPDEKLEALVGGIRDGDTGDKLLTIHADYQRGTSLDNDAELVDFNNWQTSQWCCPAELPRKESRGWRVWDAIAYDYSRTPVKPTLDAEAWYENTKGSCGADAYIVRRRAYYTVLAGGFGFTYGAGGIWDGLLEPVDCSTNWEGALNHPGYHDIGHLSEWMHSLGNGLLTMGPDQSMIVEGQSDDYDHHIQAAVAKSGKFAAVYSGDNDAYVLDLRKMSCPVIKARWFDPRWGTWLTDVRSPYSNISQYQVFDPPDHNTDWLLFLTDTSEIVSIRPYGNPAGGQRPVPGTRSGFTVHVPLLRNPDPVFQRIWNVSGRAVAPHGAARSGPGMGILITGTCRP